MSPQVLNEAYWVASRKTAFVAARVELRIYLEACANWASAPLTSQTTFHAMDLMERHRVGFWDSLLLASAIESGAAYFLSEDLSDGQVFGPITVVDPFKNAPGNVM